LGEKKGDKWKKIFVIFMFKQREGKKLFRRREHTRRRGKLSKIDRRRKYYI
jgi:hypothetical protein